MINTTFHGNTAQVGGGLDNYEEIVLVLNSTAAENTASLSSTSIGGLRLNGGSLALRNTIAANNPGGNCSSDITDGGHNLRWPAADTSCVCAYGDPKLGLRGYYGGLTPLLPLMWGSAAVDAGDNAACAAAPVGGRDQRGFPRPIGPACDIGAVEQERALYLPFITK